MVGSDLSKSMNKINWRRIGNKTTIKTITTKGKKDKGFFLTLTPGLVHCRNFPRTPRARLLVLSSTLPSLLKHINEE